MFDSLTCYIISLHFIFHGGPFQAPIYSPKGSHEVALLADPIRVQVDQTIQRGPTVLVNGIVFTVHALHQTLQGRNKNIVLTMPLHPVAMFSINFRSAYPGDPFVLMRNHRCMLETIFINGSLLAVMPVLFEHPYSVWNGLNCKQLSTLPAATHAERTFTFN